MQFLSDVYLRCPDCNGTRYRDEVLEVKVDGRSIADGARAHRRRGGRRVPRRVGDRARLRPLVDVGLDYLRLGQPVPTLSGGERSASSSPATSRRPTDARSRCCRAVPKDGAASRRGLFLFDEPTTGLHFEDVSKLLASFRKLIAAGHSLVVIEHNLDVIAPRIGSSTSPRRRRSGWGSCRSRHAGAGDESRRLAHRPRSHRLRESPDS
jgi:excinuclease ABC subunit A